MKFIAFSVARISVTTVLGITLIRRRKRNFCCTGSRENYFGSIGQQNNPQFKA